MLSKSLTLLKQQQRTGCRTAKIYTTPCRFVQLCGTQEFPGASALTYTLLTNLSSCIYLIDSATPIPQTGSPVPMLDKWRPVEYRTRGLNARPILGIEGIANSMDMKFG